MDKMGQFFEQLEYVKRSIKDYIEETGNLIDIMDDIDDEFYFDTFTKDFTEKIGIIEDVFQLLNKIEL